MLGHAPTTPGRLSTGRRLLERERGRPRRAIWRCERFGDRAPAIRARRTWLAWCLAELGRVRRGDRRGEEASGSPRRSIIPAASSSRCSELGPRLPPPGRLSTSHPAARTRPRALPVRGSSPSSCPRWPRSRLCLCAVRAARRGPAAPGAGGGAAAASGRRTGITSVRCHLGEAYLLAGRLDEAPASRRACPRAGAPAAGTRARGLGPAPPRRDRRASGPSGRASPPRPTTARPWPWPTSSACARSSPTATSASASSTGAPATSAKAQEHLTTATTMYREMDMRFWLEKAEVALKEVRSDDAQAE